MATKGRGGDSMLVHMTPGEVQALQTLAERHGGTLTINPETGQPEANFLKKMLPMIAGLALAPLTAGTSLAFLGATPLASAMTVGGITGLATGSLSRGLMAGLGAYGGASLGAGLANMGATAVAPDAMVAANASPDAIMSLTAAKDAATAAAEGFAGAGAGAGTGAAGAAGAGTVAAGAEAAKQGLSMAANNPGSFVNAMGGTGKTLQAGLMAASPMLAADTVQTTTKRPDTGYIRNFTFDPYGQTYSDAGSYPASEYKGMAQGGIVALAAGGDYRSLTKDSTADQIASAYKQAVAGSGGDTKANQDVAINYLTNLGIGQDRIGEAYSKFQASPTYTDYTQQNAVDYFRANPNIDIAAETARLNANPMLVNQAISQLGQGYLDPTQTAGGSGAGQYYDALKSAGIDANELYAANKALNPDYSGYSLSEMQRAFNVAKQFDTYQYDSAAGDQLAKDIAALKQYDAGNFGGDRSQQILDIARETGLSLNEATSRYDAARAAMAPKPTAAPTAAPTGIAGISAPAGTTLDDGVSGGGNTVVNRDGTITTRPDLSLGMGQVRDKYTQGGGSLGYANAAPKTMEEFDQRFNKQTDDSLAAYEYLMGKGANPIKSGVGEIMRPYSEAVRGVPAAEGRPTQKYIYQDGKYVENPNYRPMSYDSKGNRNVGMTSTEVLKGFNALPDKSDDKAIFDWVDKNKITLAQLAKAMGIPLAEAQRRRDAAAKNKKDADETAKAPVGDTAANGGLMGMAAGGYAVGGGLGALAGGGQAGYNLGGYSDGGRLLKGPGDGVSDSIPATIGRNKQPARLADGEFVVPARIVSELGNGSTEAGARKLYAMMDRVQKARGRTTGKRRVAANTRSEKYLPA
jgi:hypothetical protein